MTTVEQRAVTTQFDHLNLKFEPEHELVWAKFVYPGRPCMSNGMLSDLGRAQKIITDMARANAGHSAGRLRYQVLASETPAVFNLGGDLAYFIELIRAGDREALFAYAKACIDILYPSACNYKLPFTTIALVQGETLGGGFEAALSANVLIAERSARFGFPETVFGMFPGMGAFSFLARRLAPALAKRVITSGKVYSAEELYEMGVVDVLVPDGRGEEAVYDYIRHQHNRSGGLFGLERVADQFNPLSYEELLNGINIWVDTALELSAKNLRMMEYLLNAQERRWVSHDPLPARRAVG